MRSCSYISKMTDPFAHLSLDKNGGHFVDDIFKCIFLNEKVCILIKISSKFVPKGSSDKKPGADLDKGLVN